MTVKGRVKKWRERARRRRVGACTTQYWLILEFRFSPNRTVSPRIGRPIPAFQPFHQRFPAMLISPRSPAPEDYTWSHLIRGSVNSKI